jgi:hypothetical protein
MSHRPWLRLVRDAIRGYLGRVRQAATEARETEILRRHEELLARQAAALIEDQAEL